MSGAKRVLSAMGRNDTDKPGVDERVLFHKIVETYDQWVASSIDVTNAINADAGKATVNGLGLNESEDQERLLLWLKFAVCALEDGFSEANCRFSGQHPLINPGTHRGCQCKYR